MSVPLRYRAREVLGRFPCHWQAVDGNKLLAHVVVSMARELDVLAADLGRVRQAHRLHQADEWRDLLQLGGLHGLSTYHFSLLQRRLFAFADVARALIDQNEPALAVTKLAELLAVADTELVPAPEDPRSEAEFQRAMGAQVLMLSLLAEELDAMRAQIEELIGAHRLGNATPEHLLRAAASYLQLRVDLVGHSEDRFWHWAGCRDRFVTVLAEQAATDEAAISRTTLDDSQDILALEENPFEEVVREPVDHKDADRFTIDRHGFDTVATRIHVIGKDDYCWGPMIVNLHSGAGLWFQGNVPDGEELVFGADGHAQLAETDVTDRVWSFRGGLYADKGASDEQVDFVFGDANAEEDGQPERVATFAESQPTNDAFEPEHPIPHAPGVFEPAELRVGTTRWAFFVQRAHFGARRGDPPVDEPAVNLYHAGWFDESVLNPADSIAASIGFSWEDRQAFTVTLWIPERFAQLDEPGEPEVTATLERLLTRHRAAGIRLNVAYATNRWTLGEGVLRDAESLEIIGTALVGTSTWPDGTPQEV